MAHVVCTEFRDGEQTGANDVPGPVPGEPADVVLDRKRASALTRGWNITDLPDGFDAEKIYGNGVIKYRQFRIVED